MADPIVQHLPSTPESLGQKTSDESLPVVLPSDYSIPVDTTGLATEAKQDSIIAEIDGVEESLTSVEGKLDTANGNLTTIIAEIDGIEESLVTLIAEVDGVEESLTSIEGKLDTISGHVDGVEGALATLNAKDFATETTLATRASEATLSTATGHVARVPGSFLSGVSYDYASQVQNATDDVWTFKSGGSGGTTVATLTITYTDATKAIISSVART